MELMNNVKVTYTPEGPIVQGFTGPFLTTRLMFRELLSSVWLIWMLFLRDTASKYRQSLLGILWVIVNPLITIGLFMGMSRSGILSIPDLGIPYPLYAIIGLTIWNLFTVGAISCANSLINAGSMIVKINFPKVALVVAASAHGLVEFMIRLIIIAFAFVYYGFSPDWTGLLTGLIFVIPMYLITVGIGFVLSLATGVVRDIPNIVNMLLTAVMLLSPVLYPIKGDTILGHANLFNPFNYLVNVPRDLIINGHSDMLTGFTWVSLFAGCVFFLGWRLFYLAQTKIAERI